MRTGNVPIFRGLFDIIQQRHVRYFSFCASARIGKTLLAICVLLYWIAEKFGPPGWLDPTRSSAGKLVRGELDEFLLLCKPVRALAVAPPPDPAARRFWTTLVKIFRGKIFRIIGAGAEAELHGYNLELAINNEVDQQLHVLSHGAISMDKFEARTALFARTRLILDNSTPGKGGELSMIWQRFLARSQRYCYLPCPHCSAPAKNFVPTSWDDVEPGRSPLSYDSGLAGWQRLTFGIEQKLVPFAANLDPVPPRTPKEKWHEETTGQFKFSQFAIFEDRPRQDDPTKTEPVKVGYDLEAVEHGTTYECAHCKKEIDLHRHLLWMEERFRWVAHNPFAARDRESAQCWAAYNPFQHPGIIAKEFIEAKGNVSALIKFRNLTQGLPASTQHVAIKEDDLDRAARRCPRPYARGTLPLKPEFLTMCVDVGGMHTGNFWWSIRAWGILWDHPELPTWSGLIDWGPAVAWSQLEEFAGLIPLPQSKGSSTRFNEYVWRDPASGEVTRFRVTAGLIDSGFEAKEEKNVYEFCEKWDEVFSPSKGGSQNHLRGNQVRVSPVYNAKLELVWYWDDWFKSALYYHAIKEGHKLWFLPTNLDEDYRTQLTIEHTIWKNGRREWEGEGAHLADTEKEHEVLRDTIEDKLDEIREAHRTAERDAEEEAKSVKSLD